MSNAGAGLLLSSSADVRAALLGSPPGSSWALTAEDHLSLERLTRLRALLFDSNESELAAQLYTEDAVHEPMVGRDAIAKGYASQARARSAGKFRLRSRHHVSNLVVKPCAGELPEPPPYHWISGAGPERLRRVCRGVHRYGRVLPHQLPQSRQRLCNQRRAVRATSRVS